MLEAQAVSEKSKDFETIKRLYESAFPYKERLPVAALLETGEETVFCAVYEKELLCGLFCLLRFRGITHIAYLAVTESHRDRGYGSKILQMIHEIRPQDRIIADIEAENRMAGNHEQRTRRKNFYIRNGYQETGIFYTWHDVPYQILSYGGTVSQSEFFSFWQHFEDRKTALAQPLNFKIR